MGFNISSLAHTLIMLMLIGALAIIVEYGIWLVFFGLLLIFIPALSGLFIWRKLLRIPLLNCLSCNMTGMTFTPSMVALSQKTECDDVVAAYAATYPLALVSLVFTGQILLKILV